MSFTRSESTPVKAIIDCNSFYASCERVFQPALWHKPVVVLSNNDGCIIARTDEAKALGIPMAAPYFKGKELMEKNGVTVFSSNYCLYGDMSHRVMTTLHRLVPRIEVYSVDEAFADLGNIAPHDLEPFVRHLQNTVYQWTGIPVSIGAAPTKTLAKVANRLSKKNKAHTQGIQLLLTAAQQVEALQQTPVEEIWGIGRANASKLRARNIHTALQLRNLPEKTACNLLGGVTGVRLVKELKGIPCIGMEAQLEQKKQIACTRSFGKPVTTLTEMKEAVATYTSRAAEKLRRQHSAACMLTVFLQTSELSTDEYCAPAAHQMLPMATALTHLLIRRALQLTEQLFEPGRRYKKAGVVLSGLVPDDAIQGHLFEALPTQAQRRLMHVMDNINCSMRGDVVKFAATGLQKNWKMRQEQRSPRYTTRWEELRVVHAI